MSESKDKFLFRIFKTLEVYKSHIYVDNSKNCILGSTVLHLRIYSSFFFIISNALPNACTHNVKYYVKLNGCDRHFVFERANVCHNKICYLPVAPASCLNNYPMYANWSRRPKLEEVTNLR